jgi:hypothetical protein
MPRRPLLLDGFDSKIIPSGKHTSDVYQKDLLRTRLIAMAEILFGGRVIVTEGWALDSVSFLAIGAEIARAYKALVDEGKINEDDGFTPLLMETRRETDYLAVFDAYLKRPEVRWHSFPDKFRDREIAKALSAMIAESKTMTRHRFYEGLHDATGSSFLSGAVQSVSEYFGSDSRKFVQGQPKSGLFQRRFYAHLSNFSRYVSHSKWHDSIAEEILRARRMMLAGRNRFPTSTSAMDYIDRNFPPEVAVHLKSTVTGAFLDVSAQLTDSHRTTSPAIKEVGLPTWVENRLPDVNDDGRASYASQIMFSYKDLEKSALGARLQKEEDWPEIWKSVLRLAQDSEWKKTLTSVRRDCHVQGIQAAIDSKTFKNLETQLVAMAPKLSLKQSAVDRFRFAFRHEFGQPEHHKTVGKLLSLGASAGVLGLAGLGVTEIAQLDVGGELITAAGGVSLWALANAPKIIDLDFGSDKAVAISKRSTILRPMASLITAGSPVDLPSV